MAMGNFMKMSTKNCYWYFILDGWEVECVFMWNKGAGHVNLHYTVFHRASC